jgi:hypothetical protein
VDVLNSGTDWASIAAAAATFAAAAVGIGGTAWVAKRARESASADIAANLESATQNLRLSIWAENRRAQEDTKRRAYAACIAALNAMWPAVHEHRQAHQSGDPGLKAARWSELANAQVALLNALAEVELIAPGDVVGAAMDVGKEYQEYIRETQEGAKIGEGVNPGPAVVRLRFQMREDCKSSGIEELPVKNGLPGRQGAPEPQGPGE